MVTRPAKLVSLCAVGRDYQVLDLFPAVPGEDEGVDPDGEGRQDQRRHLEHLAKRAYLKLSCIVFSPVFVPFFISMVLY